LQNLVESLSLQEEEEEKVRNLTGDEDERAQDTDINAQWEKTKKILLIHRDVRKGLERSGCLTYRKVEERRKAKQILN